MTSPFLPRFAGTARVLRHVRFVAGEIGWLLGRAAVFVVNVALIGLAMALILVGPGAVEMVLFGTATGPGR